MTGIQDKEAQNNASQPPEFKRDEDKSVFYSRLADVVQWFLDYDARVAAMRHPEVEKLFQWKQEQSRREDPQTYHFDSAEDRLAIGIFQAVEANPDERSLHAWIGDLLRALDEASKLNEELSEAYKLSAHEGASALSEAAKIPTAREQHFYLTACWLKALCTAEARILGWIYQSLYGRAFHPGSFQDHG